jgi:hypothetical protein
MRCSRAAWLVFLLLAAAFVGVGCSHSRGVSRSAPTVSGSDSPPTTPPFPVTIRSSQPVRGASAAAACRAGLLRTSLDPLGLPGASGETITVFKVMNLSPEPCTVRGYPSVSVLDARGSTVAFTYSDGPYGGFAPYVTAIAPQQIRVAAAGSVFFALAKYRCDDGHQLVARTIRIGIPGQEPVTVSGSFVGQLVPVCSGSGNPDPGQTIQISPIEPTVVATLR